LLELESGKAEKASGKSVAQKAEECSGCRERKDGVSWLIILMSHILVLYFILIEQKNHQDRLSKNNNL